MKYKLIAIACFVALAVGTAVGVHISDVRKAQYLQSVSAEGKAHQELVARYEKVQADDQVTINKFHDGCILGQRAYDALTIAQRAVLTKQGVGRATCD